MTTVAAFLSTFWFFVVVALLRACFWMSPDAQHAVQWNACTDAVIEYYRRDPNQERIQNVHDFQEVCDSLYHQ